MKRKLIWLLAIVALIAAMLWLVSGHEKAYADPYHDVHHPSYMDGWCPGGGVGLGSGWCDGTDYADGSFWHQAGLRAFGTWRVITACKLHTGIWLQDAPLGGCGGEW